MSAVRQAPLIGRRALAIVVTLVVVLGLIVVFSGALTRSTGVEAQAEQARAEVEARQLDLEAGLAERAFFDTEAFVRWQARVNGFGRKAEGETRFALPEGAPTPAPIRPIGPQDAEGAMAPFDAWMELLFSA